VSTPACANRWLLLTRLRLALLLLTGRCFVTAWLSV
jgi:hypothetical protein